MGQTGFSRLRIRSSEHGNELSGSIKKAGCCFISWVTINFSKIILHHVVVVVVVVVVVIIIPLSLRTEHRASTVPRHPRLLFQFLGSIRHLLGLLWGGGDQSSARQRTQDNTTQKYADTHPCPDQDSNLRSQCSSGRRQYFSLDRSAIETGWLVGWLVACLLACLVSYLVS
jgi:hypothetical protein